MNGICSCGKCHFASIDDEGERRTVHPWSPNKVVRCSAGGQRCDAFQFGGMKNPFLRVVVDLCFLLVQRRRPNSNAFFRAFEAVDSTAFPGCSLLRRCGAARGSTHVATCTGRLAVLHSELACSCGSTSRLRRANRVHPRREYRQLRRARVTVTSSIHCAHWTFHNLLGRAVPCCNQVAFLCQIILTFS